MGDDLDDLAKRVNALPPADQLVLAAELLRAGRYALAETIIRRIADELAAVRLLVPKVSKRGVGGGDE